MECGRAIGMRATFSALRRWSSTFASTAPLATARCWTQRRSSKPSTRQARQVAADGTPAGEALVSATLEPAGEPWLLEPFRAESITVLGGLRLAQVLGLAVSLAALWGLARLVARPQSSLRHDDDAPLVR